MGIRLTRTEFVKVKLLYITRRTLANGFDFFPPLTGKPDTEELLGQCSESCQAEVIRVGHVTLDETRDSVEHFYFELTRFCNFN